MNQYKFKTNIKCGGCVATVTPFLNQINTIENWQVDTTNVDKILTVTASLHSPELIEQAVKQAGFQIQLIESITV
ncbi:MAG: heavy-metal-associated domain-containing protein [Bacteroidota bacterium]|jgi:copper chaperone